MKVAIYRPIRRGQSLRMEIDVSILFSFELNLPGG
jgi:hypothetical protein